MKTKGNPMKFKRQLAPVAGALLLVTGAASVALIGGGGAATAAGVPSSAFGVTLSIADNEVIPPTPSVTSTDGALVTDSVVGLPENPVLSGGVLNASAQNGAATASVTDLAVGDGLLAQLPPELTTALSDACNQLAAGLDPVTGAIDDQVLDTALPGLDDALQQIADGAADSPLDLSALGTLDLTELTDLQLTGLCEVLAGNTAAVSADTVVAQCTGDTGTTTIAGLEALGLPVDIDTSAPNGKLEIPQVLTLTVNEQMANADGTFTVNALHLNLFGQIDLIVSSATCGEVTRDAPPPNVPDESDAPAPDPVESHVPVTG
jgi:hypothetical protein